MKSIAGFFEKVNKIHKPLSGLTGGWGGGK